MDKVGEKQTYNGINQTTPKLPKGPGVYLLHGDGIPHITKIEGLKQPNKVTRIQHDYKSKCYYKVPITI